MGELRGSFVWALIYVDFMEDRDVPELGIPLLDQAYCDYMREIGRGRGKESQRE